MLNERVWYCVTLNLDTVTQSTETSSVSRERVAKSRQTVHSTSGVGVMSPVTRRPSDGVSEKRRGHLMMKHKRKKEKMKKRLKQRREDRRKESVGRLLMKTRQHQTV